MPVAMLVVQEERVPVVQSQDPGCGCVCLVVVVQQWECGGAIGKLLGGAPPRARLLSCDDSKCDL